MDSKIDALRTRRVQATIDDLNQYLQDNIGADDLVDSLQDMIKFLNQFIFENKTNNFDLKNFLVENKLTINSRVLNEALNKELKDFGPDLMKRLKTAGFQTGLFKGEGQVPNDARMKIIDNPKLAGIAYKRYPDGYEFLEVSVQREKGEELEKVAKYFSTPEGQYGPDKDAGWVIKNVRNVNPGDIYRSKLGGMNGLATITYFRAGEAGTKVYNAQIKSKDKLAAEGKKYEYSKRK